jgi:hypothetical protein
MFGTLDPDKDGSLDAKELAGRLDEAALKATPCRWHARSEGVCRRQ